MASHFHTLTIESLKKETKNTVSIVFTIPEHLKTEYRYEAGQYLTIKATVNGEEIRRSYSISSYGTENIQVSCKKIDGGKMSTYLFEKIGVGDQMEVMPPAGNFTFEDTQKDLVLFAAGSGITPIFSILKKALKEGRGAVHLYYGNRSDEEIIFKEELKALRADYSDRLMIQHFLSSDGERLDNNRAESIVNGLKLQKEQALYYICGPEGMIAAVKDGLEKASVPKDNLNIEYFASPTTEKKEVETVVSGEVNDVVAIIDDEEHRFTLEPGESILDAANRIGIDPPFSCQSGVCTTCKCLVENGEVEMENNFGLGDDEVEEGFVLACISKPKTPGVKVNWDEA